MFDLKQLLRRLRRRRWPLERMQDPKSQTRYDYSQGPMFFLGQQIVKQMQQAGYPAKILYCHRSAAHQAKIYAQGRTAPGRIVTRAKPWRSAHNYHEAVDIIHPGLAWKVGEDYWTALAACVRIVAEKYGVDLQHGHDWDGDGIPVHMDPDESLRDSAHIQLKDWKAVRDEHLEVMRLTGFERPRNEVELWARFVEVLPDVAKQVTSRR